MISLKILGTIRTPYKEPKGMPIQGIFKPDETGYAEIFDEFADCLKGVDILDDTPPFFDIKPYVTYFDYREEMCCGWYDNHFKNGNIPERTILK
jgi:tRNA (Thr-GGU) A37 N-methylase